MTPLVSVVILNWNGKKYLYRCLGSLHNISYKNIEIILVDNHSSDGSVTYVKTKFPKVRVVPLGYNAGFAKGNNIGFRYTHGKYVFFLNNDTKVAQGFLEPLVSRLQSDTHIGCIQPQIRLMDDPSLLDQVGSHLTSSGYLYHFGFHKSYTKDIYQHRNTMFSAKGAAMLIPRKVIQRIGLFDEDYHIFFEETDLCHRIWLAGYSVNYEPSSIMYHKTGGDTVETYRYAERVYLSVRNMLTTYVKNFGSLNLFTIFPKTVCIHVLLFGVFMFRRRLDLSYAILRAYIWNIKHLRQTMQKRHHVQKIIRTITDTVLNQRVIKNPRLSYYYYLLTDLRKYQDA